MAKPPLWHQLLVWVLVLVLVALFLSQLTTSGLENLWRMVQIAWASVPLREI